jgi:hypothetical protein
MELPTILVAAVLSWICLHLLKALRDPKTRPGDAVLLELGLGLLATAAGVFWLCALMEAAT